MSGSLLKSVLSFVISVIPSITLANTVYPLTVKDGMGNTLTFTQAPHHISSKTLFTDELLLELIQPQQLTSLTHLASDANFSNVADKLPKHIAQGDMNIEVVIANNPDLVFSANWSDSAKITLLKKSGIPVYLGKAHFTLRGIQGEIRKIGQILNQSERAEAVIGKMDQRLEEGVIVPDKKLTVLDYNPWGTSSTKLSSWQAILDHAGLINAVEHYSGDVYGQVPVSKELVIALNPDVLFIPGWVYGDESAAEKFKQQVLTDPALKSVKAIQSGRVYQIPQALRSTHSQYIVDAILFVNHAVYKTQ